MRISEGHSYWSTLLQVDQSTLFRWVKAAGMTLQQDPHDKRRSLLTEAQMKQLADARHIGPKSFALPRPCGTLIDGRSFTICFRRVRHAYPQ
jgi:hypothetical protein